MTERTDRERKLGDKENKIELSCAVDLLFLPLTLLHTQLINQSLMRAGQYTIYKSNI